MVVRVLLVDDQALFREALNTLLSVQSGLEVVGEAGNGEDALLMAHSLQPDVILMDLQMPILDGVGATKRLQAELPQVRVIVLTTFDDDEFVFEGLRAGAIGYLLKDTPSQKLIEAIQSASRGESFLQPSIARKVIAEFARHVSPAPQPLSEALTGREIEILRLLAQALSNREIGEKLFLSEGTVKNHISSILSKLGVRDRMQAALRAKELHLI
jgi:DNA-binding NarL/FixJ family response regulator